MVMPSVLFPVYWFTVRTAFVPRLFALSPNPLLSLSIIWVTMNMKVSLSDLSLSFPTEVLATNLHPNCWARLLMVVLV